MQSSVCAESCPTLCNPMDCCPPGSSVHGILQARILDWVAISSFRGSSWPSDWTPVSWSSALQVDSLPKFEPPGNPKHSPSPWEALIKPQGYTKSLWEGYDPWTGWPSAAHLASLRFLRVEFYSIGSASMPNAQCEVWVADSAVPAFLPEGSRESHSTFTPSNDRRPNNKQPKCASGKGWAITANNSSIAVPASCWGGGQPVLAAIPRGARPSFCWDIYGGSVVQAGGQSRNWGCQLHHPCDRLQFTKYLWARLITSIHPRSRRENWGIKSWGKYFPSACNRYALSTYCIPASMPGAENTEAKRISSPHGAPCPSSGGTWRSQSDHPGWWYCHLIKEIFKFGLHRIFSVKRGYILKRLPEWLTEKVP